MAFPSQILEFSRANGRRHAMWAPPNHDVDDLNAMLADGTYAAAEVQDFGTSRWQLAD